MTREEAMKHVKDMLVVCQKFRSNLDETIEMLDPDIDQDHVKQIHRSLFPWLGEKDVTPALADAAMGVTPLTGQGFYNFMYIAHELCKPISLAVLLIFGEDRRLPEPDATWCTLNWEPAT